MKNSNYRLKCKRYYGIDFGDEFDIHHIDLNHKNNNIDNLILLPKDVHRQYHKALQQFKINYKKETAEINIKLSNVNPIPLDFITAYIACQEWIEKRNKL